jgi:hypothetical protein
LAIICVSTAARHIGLGHDGVANNVVIIQLSPFLSLYRYLLLAMSLCHFH